MKEHTTWIIDREYLVPLQDKYIRPREDFDSDLHYAHYLNALLAEEEVRKIRIKRNKIHIPLWALVFQIFACLATITGTFVAVVKFLSG